MLLFRSNIKYYAINSPQEFLANAICEQFPTLSKSYKSIVNFSPFKENSTIDEDNIDAAIKTLIGLLLHAIVVNQKHDWFFITQIGFYLKIKKIDDVAVTSRHDKFNSKLITSIQRLQEGKGSLHELRFNVKEIEVLVTGGLSNLTSSPPSDKNGSSSTSNNKFKEINAFLGVATPADLALDDNYILLAPNIPVDSVGCTRMLRNYTKQAGMKDWCLKSSFFSSLNFTTPLPLQLYLDDKENSYVRLGSQLLYLGAFNLCNAEKFVEMADELQNTSYLNDLNLNETARKEEVNQTLAAIKNVKRHKLSVAKRLIIEIIVNSRIPNEQDLLSIANGLVLSRVKSINTKTVKAFEKEINPL